MSINFNTTNIEDLYVNSTEINWVNFNVSPVYIWGNIEVILTTTTPNETFTFNMIGTKKWGDGSSDTTTTHTYATPGTYSIYCDGTILNSEIFGDKYVGNYSVSKIHIIQNITSIGASAFFGCEGLTNLIMGNSVTSIGEYAFAGCSGLTSITIPDSVTGIGEGALSSCRNLESVTIGNSVTSIGSRSFSSCSRLTNINFNGTKAQWSAITKGSDWNYNVPATFVYCTDGVYPPTTVVNITITGPDQAFIFNMNGSKNWGDGTIDTATTHNYVNVGNYIISCDGDTMTTSSSSGLFGQNNSNPNTTVKNVIIDGNITQINSYSFRNCSGLQSVTIGNSVTSIGSSAFWECSVLTRIIIPDSVTSIDNYAFRSCSSLTSITIPDSVTSIGNGAFEYCRGLTSITIPNSVTSIGSAAFNGCSGLTSITIPDSVTSIGGNTFEGCSGLTSVTIGNSVTSIGSYAFAWCRGLTSITYNDTKSQWAVITKGSDWNASTPATVVHCTDGDIAI